MKAGSIKYMRRADVKREPLYNMTEIAERLGVNRFSISALSRAYGAIKPEFDRSSNHQRKAQFRLSAAMRWWESIPTEVRNKALLKCSKERVL